MGGGAVSCSRLGQPCPRGLPSAAHRPPSGLALRTVSGVAQQVFRVPCISNILGFPLKLRLYPHEVWVQPCRASLLCFSTPFQILPVNWFQRHHEHSHQNLGPQPLCWPDFHRSDTHKRGRVSGRGDFIWLAASETSVRGLLSPSGWERSEVERGKQQR